MYYSCYNDIVYDGQPLLEMLAAMCRDNKRILPIAHYRKESIYDYNIDSARASVLWWWINLFDLGDRRLELCDFFPAIEGCSGIGTGADVERTAMERRRGLPVT
jgi:hypothetical protein